MNNKLRDRIKRITTELNIDTPYCDAITDESQEIAQQMLKIIIYKLVSHYIIYTNELIYEYDFKNESNTLLLTDKEKKYIDTFYFLLEDAEIISFLNIELKNKYSDEHIKYSCEYFDGYNISLPIPRYVRCLRIIIEIIF